MTSSPGASVQTEGYPLPPFILISDSAKVTINEVHRLRYGLHRAHMGSFKRKAKGRTYQSPRVILKPYFSKYLGKDLLILEGKAKIQGMVLGEMPVLLLFIRPDSLPLRPGK